jgi:hypothetical protein
LEILPLFSAKRKAGHHMRTDLALNDSNQEGV